MFNRNVTVASAFAICACVSSAAFSAGLTEEGAREIARVFQPSKSQLHVFSTLAPKQAALARSALASMTPPGPATQTFNMWHEFALNILAFDHTPKVDDQTGKQLHLQEFGPHRASYVMAKLHLAMYEVANAFEATPGWSWIETTLPGAVGSPPNGASEGAALAAAARTILNDLYSGDDYHIDSEYLISLSDLGVAPTDQGVAFGTKVASLIIGLRANDKSNLQEPVWGEDFAPKAGLGTAFQWEVDPVSGIKVALGGNWGMVTPFVSKKSQQFRRREPIIVPAAAHRPHLAVVPQRPNGSVEMRGRSSGVQREARLRSARQSYQQRHVLSSQVLVIRWHRRSLRAGEALQSDSRRNIKGAFGRHS